MRQSAEFLMQILQVFQQMMDEVCARGSGVRGYLRGSAFLEIGVATETDPDGRGRWSFVMRRRNPLLMCLRRWSRPRSTRIRWPWTAARTCLERGLEITTTVHKSIIHNLEGPLLTIHQGVKSPVCFRPRPTRTNREPRRLRKREHRARNVPICELIFFFCRAIVGDGFAPFGSGVTVWKAWTPSLHHVPSCGRGHAFLAALIWILDTGDCKLFSQQSSWRPHPVEGGEVALLFWRSSSVRSRRWWSRIQKKQDNQTPSAFLVTRRL